MILTCPECGTRYQTEAALFAPEGRKVRCAKCGHSWHQAPEVPEKEADGDVALAAADPAIAPASGNSLRNSIFAQGSPDVAVSNMPPRREEKWAALAGWAGLAAILLLLGWSAFKFRQDIVTLWPQSASVFSALGLQVTPRGIEFEKVTYNHSNENGRPVLAVTGELVNTSQHELSVPPILVIITDQNRQELYRWNYKPGVATLRPGQAFDFLTQLPNPPDGGRHIEVRFATAGK